MENVRTILIICSTNVDFLANNALALLPPRIAPLSFLAVSMDLLEGSLTLLVLAERLL
jgi:hypothetical protein